MSHSRDPATVLAARQQFLGDGRLPAMLLASHVGRSWQRCLRWLDNNLPGPEPLARGDFRARREAAQVLIEMALPELETLAGQMDASHSVIILADAQGLILDEQGSADFLRLAQRVALQPGVDWSEGHCGTNAIGTALVEREPLEVRGAEHFLEANKVLSCAAAPILSSRGEVLGVLDVSGDAAQLHLHALALVKLAAEQIEHRLIRAAARGRRLLHFHPKVPMLGTAREGLLLLEDDRIAGASPTAAHILGLDWQQMLGQPLDQLFDRRWRMLGGEQRQFHTHRGVMLTGLMESGPAPARAARPEARGKPASLSPFEADRTIEPLLTRAVRVLDAGGSVLLQGETGVGKDVFAGLLHQRSTRSGGPFVALNCAAMPETLVEAELFGYAEGAFTGAQRKGRIGRVREANGGVLFLDEIGDMPLALQPRLLRVLQERRVTPLGGDRSVPVDFALVCATHCDLQAMVPAGNFRADLFYRLQDYTVTLPALRERNDIGDLIERLFERAGGAARGLTLTREARDELARRSWPGNLRELASVLRTLVALAETGDVIDCDRLPPRPAALSCNAAASVAAEQQPVSPTAPPLPLRELTTEAIERALTTHAGHVAAAARALGVHRATIYRHLAHRRSSSGPR
jgi:transcriptional regulator of acetoin/glycerol metabolism